MIRAGRINRVRENRAGARQVGRDFQIGGSDLTVNLHMDLGNALSDLAADLSEREARELRQFEQDLEDGAFGDTNEGVVMVYMTEADERVRPEHAALHGTVWQPNDPDMPVPPLGPNCRCRLEPRAVDADTAKATGLPQVEKSPPEPGAEAMRRFWNEAEHSRESDQPGEPVTPTDTLGRARGSLVERGQIDPDELIDDDGAIVPIPIAEALAGVKGQKDIRTVFQMFARLEGAGLPANYVKEVRNAARKVRDRFGSDKAALVDVLIKGGRGFVRARSGSETRKRAGRLADNILRTYGGSLVPRITLTARQVSRFRAAAKAVRGGFQTDKGALMHVLTGKPAEAILGFTLARQQAEQAAADILERGAL